MDLFGALFRARNLKEPRKKWLFLSSVEKP
jgi:hypothetical protein